MQLDVDDGGQSKEVVRVDCARASGRPDMRAVQYLERELTGVSWESTGDGEIE